MRVVHPKLYYFLFLCYWQKSFVLSSLTLAEKFALFQWGFVVRTVPNWKLGTITFPYMLVVVNAGQCSSRQCGRGLETLTIQIVQSGSTVCIDFKISVSFSLLRYRLFSNGIHQATVFMCLTWTHMNQSYSARAFTITEKPLCQRSRSWLVIVCIKRRNTFLG